MSARTIGFVAKKGGVGKTTSALAVGSALMRDGHSVLFIDLDSQFNLTSTMKATTSGPNIFGVLLRQVSAKDAIQHTEMGDIIAATEDLNGSDAVINQTGKEYRLKETLACVEDLYDFIIVDTPPALEVLTICALTACDEIVVMTQADLYSYDSIKQLWKAILATRQYTNKDLKVSGFLVNRYNKRANISKTLKGDLESMAKKLDTKVFRTEVRECTALKEAQFRHQSIFDYAPASNAAADYSAVLEELKEDWT